MMKSKTLNTPNYLEFEEAYLYLRIFHCHVDQEVFYELHYSFGLPSAEGIPAHLHIDRENSIYPRIPSTGFEVSRGCCLMG